MQMLLIPYLGRVYILKLAVELARPLQRSYSSFYGITQLSNFCDFNYINFLDISTLVIEMTL